MLAVKLCTEEWNFNINIRYMKTDKYYKILESNFKEALELSKKKNKDYANIDDPFYNFKMVEMLGITVEQGIMIRMLDKLSRINNLTKREGVIMDEKIDDTLTDLMNYANILKTYISEK